MTFGKENEANYYVSLDAIFVEVVGTTYTFLLVGAILIC